MPLAIIIAEDGVDDLELYYARYRLMEEGYDTLIASSRKFEDTLIIDPKSGSITRARRRLTGKYGIRHEVDITYDEALTLDFDILVIPGGRSPERARQNPKAVELVRKAYREGKTIIAICHGPQLLISAGIAKGKKLTGHPGIRDDIVNAGGTYTGSGAEKDGNIITIRHTTTIHEGFKLL